MPEPAPAKAQPTSSPPESRPPLTLEAYAALHARLDAAPDERDRWLDEAEVDSDIYEDADKRLTIWIESSALRGHTEPLERFDTSYVTALGEVIERPLDVATYARIEVGAEQGALEATLDELGLPATTLGPIRRHFTRLAIEDDGVRRHLREEMTRLRHGG